MREKDGIINSLTTKEEKMNHSFVISKNEVPENKIEKELEMLRNKHQGFKMTNKHVQTSPLGVAIVTIEFNVS